MGTRVVAGRYALELPEAPCRGCAIWRARDAETGAPVRVVLLDEHPDADATLAALAAVRHPALPVVLDRGVDGAARFAVLPARTGESARSRLAEPPSLVVAVDLGVGLADALAALHEAGLAQGPFDLSAIVVDNDGRPRFEEPATAGLGRPADQPDDDVRCLAALLRGLVGVPDGAEPLEVDGMPPRLAGLLLSMASIAPPSAAASRDALRAVVRAEDVGELADPAVGGPLATPGDAAAATGAGRGLKVLVAALAVIVVGLGAVVLAQTVDRRDAAERAAASALPGPVATTTAPPATTTAPPVTTDAASTATTATIPAPAGPDRSVRRIAVVAVTPLDPGGDGHENDAQARLVVDPSTATAWSTEAYRPGVVAKKGGVGLRLRLASPTRVRRVVLRSAPLGATVALYGVRGPAPAGAPPSGWVPLAPAQGLWRARAAIRSDHAGPVAEVLVWIVGVPQSGSGEGVSIADIVVLGVPVGA